MAQSQRMSGGKFEVVDDEYPELMGTGKTLEQAQRDFNNQKRVTWTAKRISEVQGTIDRLLFQAEAATESDPINREQHRELQDMMDEFVGLMRKQGVVETALDHKEVGSETRPIRRRGG